MDTPIFRHGDVTLQAAKIPEDAQKVFEGTAFVVQEGEQTGHAHKIIGSDFTVSELKGVRYYSFPTAVTITHEEHKTITILPGTYKQQQEREYDWFQNTIRQVID